MESNKKKTIKTWEFGELEDETYAATKHVTREYIEHKESRCCRQYCGAMKCEHNYFLREADFSMATALSLVITMRGMVTWRSCCFLARFFRLLSSFFHCSSFWLHSLLPAHGAKRRKNSN